MPNSRLIQVLGALSLLLIGLALFLFYRQIPRHRYPYAKSVDQAAGICLVEGPRGVQLNKRGEEWLVHAVTAPEVNVSDPAGSFSAENDRVKTLLSGLKEVQVEDVISDRPDRQSEFDINVDSGMRVVLLSRSAALADGIFGKQAPDFTHIYFRFPNQSSIYLARGVIRGDLGRAVVADWRRHDLIPMSEAQIQSIHIEGKGFKTDLARSSDTWTLNGEKIDPAPVYSLLGALAHLRADDFVDPAADPHLTYDSLTAARILLQGAPSSVELRLGAEDKPKNRCPVSISPESGVAWISQNAADALLKKPADFKPKK